MTRSGTSSHCTPRPPPRQRRGCHDTGEVPPEARARRALPALRGPDRIRRGPGGTRAASSTVSKTVESLTLPGVTMMARGRPRPSAARWTLVVSPPRDRPSPWPSVGCGGSSSSSCASAPLFASCGGVLVGTTGSNRSWSSSRTGCSRSTSSGRSVSGPPPGRAGPSRDSLSGTPTCHRTHGVRCLRLLFGRRRQVVGRQTQGEGRREHPGRAEADPRARRARARVRREKGIRWGGRPLATAA